MFRGWKSAHSSTCAAGGRRNDRNGAKIIDAEVPLSEMFGYATELRSRTQGRGVYTMQPEHYEPVPKSIQEKVCGAKTAK